MVAVAVNEGDRREGLGVATGPSEGRGLSRTGFLRSLADRGLRGVKLVVADDHKALRAAALRVFGATHPRCRAHWARNALAHAGAKHRAAVSAMLKTIFARGRPKPPRPSNGARSPMRSAPGTPSWVT